jgi:hypothetical protein
MISTSLLTSLRQQREEGDYSPSLLKGEEVKLLSLPNKEGFREIQRFINPSQSPLEKVRRY